MSTFSFLGRYTLRFEVEGTAYSGLTLAEIEEIAKFIHYYLRPSELVNIIMDETETTHEESKEMGLRLSQVELNKTRKVIHTGSYAGIEFTFKTEKCIPTSAQYTIKNALEKRFNHQRIKYHNYGRGEIVLGLEIYSMSSVLVHTLID